MTHNPHHPHPAFGASGHAWPALLALTQANRDAASALLLAMKAFGQFSEQDVQPEEMHCWYTDAHDAADVATQAARVLGDFVSPPFTPRCRRSGADIAGTYEAPLA